jgi:hypothetical protein
MRLLIILVVWSALCALCVWGWSRFFSELPKE